MKQSVFIAKWERQRAKGRWVYGLIHAVIIGGALGLLYLVFHLTDLSGPENLTPKMIAFFALGGFAYGLIRFNIRERFYIAMKGHSDDRP